MSVLNYKQLSAPSNIAVLKYWGKKDGQHPINPSLSFTLKNSKTNLNYKFKKRDDRKIQIVEFKFDKCENVSFKEKLESKIQKIMTDSIVPFGVDLWIDTHNTFPHSAGIASSASSMAAIVKMFAEIYSIYNINQLSSLAREFSGSACRSISLGWNLWGETLLHSDANQDFALNINSRVHPDFHSLQDWVFVCSHKSKGVSSTDGHKLMDKHCYLENRLTNVHNRLKVFFKLLEVKPSIDFFNILEQEALDLHALMMTSNPSVMLIEPESLILMKKITDLRSQGLNCGYTLDAGSSVHLLFPLSELDQMNSLMHRKYFGHMGLDFVDVIYDECISC